MFKRAEPTDARSNAFALMAERANLWRAERLVRLAKQAAYLEAARAAYCAVTPREIPGEEDPPPDFMPEAPAALAAAPIPIPLSDRQHERLDSVIRGGAPPLYPDVVQDGVVKEVVLAAEDVPSIMRFA